MNNRVHVAVGNTYQRLEPYEAPSDKSGRYKKIHDWTLFVDVTADDSSGELCAAIIEKVTFELPFGSFTCNSPVRVFTEENGAVLRFSTRQQTYAPVGATVAILGAGGTSRRIQHEICCNAQAPRKTKYSFFQEPRPVRPLRMVKMPDSSKFGIELELTSNLTANQVAAHLPGNVHVIDSYSAGRVQVDEWKIVPDGSIVCNRSLPNCNTFELVSPVLRGGQGLSQVSSMVQGLLGSDANIKINKSMGFHVHIDVSEYSVAQLVKICQNFIKYEDVIDSFLPLSRRTGSAESNQFFQSNRSSVGSHLTNKQRHQVLADCTDVASLCRAMNSGDNRYYKLNLQNLRTGRQPTLEFRQHSATIKYDKISAWIRLCTLFCVNSARLAPPKSFASGRSLDQQCEALFSFVIKDRALAQFYQERQGNLKLERLEDEHCCSGCAHGGACSSRLSKQIQKYTT